jgi:hypothetical protein
MPEIIILHISSGDSQRKLWDKSPLGPEFGNPSAVQEVGIQITDGVDLKNAFLIAEKLA